MNAGLMDYYAARAPEYDRVYKKPERQAVKRGGLYDRAQCPSLTGGEAVRVEAHIRPNT
jgi:hypothetical protein